MPKITAAERKRLSAADIAYLHKIWPEMKRLANWTVIHLGRLAYMRGIKSTGLSREQLIRKLRVPRGKSLKEKLRIAKIQTSEIYGGSPVFSRKKVDAIIRKL